MAGGELRESAGPVATSTPPPGLPRRHRSAQSQRPHPPLASADRSLAHGPAGISKTEIAFGEFGPAHDRQA